MTESTDCVLTRSGFGIVLIFPRSHGMKRTHDKQMNQYIPVICLKTSLINYHYHVIHFQIINIYINLTKTKSFYCKIYKNYVVKNISLINFWHMLTIFLQICVPCIYSYVTQQFLSYIRSYEQKTEL